MGEGLEVLEEFLKSYFNCCYYNFKEMTFKLGYLLEFLFCRLKDIV